MKKKVLIIDDDLDVCREIKYSLQNETTDVYYALSAKDGLEQFAKHQFCLVIMDIQLSETDGLYLLEQMRKMNPMPILVLSSKNSSEAKIDALRAGTVGYMEKPYALEECLAHAQSLIQLYSDIGPVSKRHYTLAFGMALAALRLCHCNTSFSRSADMAAPLTPTTALETRLACSTAAFKV